MWLEPDWGAENRENEKPVSISGVLHVSGLTIGSKYHVMRYESVKALPKSDFGKSVPFDSFVAQDATSQIPVGNMSSKGYYFYRVVRA